MENIVYFDIIKVVNGQLTKIRKYFDVATKEIVDLDVNDTCNFVLTTNTKMSISCAKFCGEIV